MKYEYHATSYHNGSFQSQTTWDHFRFMVESGWEPFLMSTGEHTINVIYRKPKE